MTETPDDPETDETPEEFREQPGDREPDGEVAAAADPDPDLEGDPDPEPEPDPDPEPLAADGDQDPEPEPAKKDWRDRQIAKLRDREKARDTELAEIRARAEAAEALLAATPEEREQGLTETTRETIRKEEAAKLEQKSYFERINSGLVNMDNAGKTAFAKTWDARITEARDTFQDELMARPDFLEAVTDLPNAAAVYHELAGDLDKMEAVLKMPAHKMGMELARLSDKLAKPAVRAVSKVPPPFKPIERGGQEQDIEALANDPSPEAMKAFDRRMKAEEARWAKERASH